MHTDSTAAPPAPRARDAPKVSTYTEAGLDKFSYHKAIKRARDLTPAQKCALYAAWDYADAGDGTFFLSAATLAEDLGYQDKGHKGAKRLLAALQDKGYLARIKKGGARDGRNLANTYVLTLPAPDTDDDERTARQGVGVNTTPTVGVNTTPTVGVNTTPLIDPLLDPVLDPRDTPLACSTPTASPPAARAAQDKPRSTVRPRPARTPHQLILDAMQDAASTNRGLPTEALIARVRARHGDDAADRLDEYQWTMPQDLAPHEDPERNLRDRKARTRAGAKLRTFLNTCLLDGLDVDNHPDVVDPYPERPLYVAGRDELVPADLVLTAPESR